MNCDFSKKLFWTFLFLPISPNESHTLYDANIIIPISSLQFNHIIGVILKTCFFHLNYIMNSGLTSSYSLPFLKPPIIHSKQIIE